MQAAIKLLDDQTLSGEFIDEIKKARANSESTESFDGTLSKWWASKGYATSVESIERKHDLMDMGDQLPLLLDHNIYN